MQEERKELHKRILVNLVVALAVVLAVIFLLPRLLRFFMPLIVAWIVALIANPVIHFLEKRIKIMRKHGTALVIILVLAAIGVALYGLAAFSLGQVSSLTQELPMIIGSVRDNLQQAAQNLHSRYHFIPSDIMDGFFGGNREISDYLMTALNSLLDGLKPSSFSKVGSVASSLVDFIVYAVLTILASYFMTVEKDNISEGIRKFTPEGVQKLFLRIKHICLTAMGGYFMAHFKIMVVIFFITVIPFSVMGISYSALLATLIAVVDFLPFLGAGTILCPWAVYLLATGSYRNGIVLIVLYLVVMVVRQLLEPKLIGDSVGINSFQILIFMLIGYRLGGMLGLIVGIPAGMILKECWQEGMFERYIRGIRILAHDINEYRKY